ncbi:MAG: hypothetical protein LH615_13755, partial [Ferruginibacter sp.]|nr:hypothetical protein [Ferruginibacter sp.]
MIKTEEECETWEVILGKIEMKKYLPSAFSLKVGVGEVKIKKMKRYLICILLPILFVQTNSFAQKID